MSTIPDRIDDRYQIIETLGSGGMADVYLAKDEKLDRLVAVKVLGSRFAKGEEFVKRFHREARAAAGLSHPHIVEVHDSGEVGGVYYIVMEYLKGKTLEEVIREEEQLLPEKASDITLQILDAMSYAHEHGIIHRDIKPQNVVLTGQGEVKVTDFGIAMTTNITTRMTTEGSILGTSHYLSPEQAAGREVVPGSDLYSVGIVLYEMLTGRVPFGGDNLMEVINKHLNEGPVPPNQVDASIPENLSNTVLNAMGKDPGIRYRSAQEFKADLERSREGLPVSLRQGAPLGQASSYNTILASQVACPSCGVANPLGLSNCQRCGKQISGISATGSLAGSGATAPTVVTQSLDNQDRASISRKAGRYTPHIVIFVLVIAVALVGSFFVISMSTNKSNAEAPVITNSETRADTQTGSVTTPTETVTQAHTVTVTAPTVTIQSASYPIADQIKSDLLGERLRSNSGGSGLEFEALREFQQFDIISVEESGNILEYDVSMIIKDYETNVNYRTNVLVVYKLYDNDYEFVSVSGSYHEM